MLDWVYRGNLHDVGGLLIDDMGSYAANESILVAGIPTANVHQLYDSHNFTANTVAGQFDAPRVRVMAPGRAEGRRAFIKHVQGMIILRPSTWAVGSSFRYGVRFGIFEQDAGSGGILIDPAYTMWVDPITNSTKTNVWANDRKWQHERRLVQTFDDNDQLWMLRFSFRVGRSLNPNESYAAFSESAAGSVNLFEQFWFRTLLEDER